MTINQKAINRTALWVTQETKLKTDQHVNSFHYTLKLLHRWRSQIHTDIYVIQDGFHFKCNHSSEQTGHATFQEWKGKSESRVSAFCWYTTIRKCLSWFPPPLSHAFAYLFIQVGVVSKFKFLSELLSYKIKSTPSDQSDSRLQQLCGIWTSNKKLT